MLELIHRYRKTFLGVVGVGAAALLMTSFGLAGSVGSSRAVAITIDGEEISLSEFERERSMTEENYRRVFGPDYQRFLAGMNLRQQVADSMIAGHLLKRTATSFDFVAASDGIRNAISTATGGQADPQRYAQLLRQIGMNARQFEARVSDQVLNTAFRSLLNDATFPSRAEALSSLVYRETSYDFEYIALDPTTFVENVSPPSEEELEEFYQEIVTDYEIPERIAYDYVTFNPEKFLDIVEVVDEDLELYYSENQDKFKSPEEVRARHIQFTFPENATQEDRIAIKKTAEEVLAQAQAGETFETLVGIYSDDLATKTLGGDLGWFARGKMADAFENAAFKLKSGGLSDLIRTSYGYHIVKVEGYRAPRVPDLSEVRAQVELAIRREQAPAYTSEKAYELFELWLEQSKLALSEFAAANGAIANSSSGTLSASDDPEAQLPGLSRKLLELPQDTRRIIEIGDKTVIAEVREFVESDLPVLNEIRNKVLQRYKEKMSVEVAREQAREILDGVNKNVFASLKSAAEKFSLSHKEEKDIKRFSTASQILRDAKIKQAVFSTWANGTTLPEVYEFESKLYLLRVLSVAQPDPDSLRERVEENRLSLARTMGSTFAESLVNSMKAGSTIEIEAGVF